MKNVVIFGAAGKTGRYITEKMLTLPDVKLSVFVRDPEKLTGQAREKAAVMQGDARNRADVEAAMQGQDILLCSLEGDVLTMADNIVAALEHTSVKRIIWITGMGIHHEIAGVRGKMLDLYAKSRPEYIQAADHIAASRAVTTLLRCPEIRDGANEVYYLTAEDVQPRNKPVERAAIAKCMADMVEDEKLGADESLGITS